MLSYTTHTLKKIETLLKEAGYQLRLGKGHFNTGYCVLETKKVIVVNKYHSTEARILALIQLVQQLPIESGILSDKMQKWYEQLLTHS